MIKQFPLSYHKFSESFSSFGFRCPKDLNPFLNLDIFHMSQPTFPPHPHAGFSAITYLFPKSQGSFQNRDSKGDQSIIEAGGLHWTQAAQGMMHEEIPTHPGIDCYGLQMFIKMPANQELDASQAFHLSPSEIPAIQGKGYVLRVLAGSFAGEQSKLNQIKPTINFYDVSLDKDKTISFPYTREKVSLLLCLEGEIQINQASILTQNEILAIEGLEGVVDVASLQETSQFLFLSAVALKEDYIWSGPFCLSSDEKLTEAKWRYQQGKMGNLSPSFRTS